MTAWSLVQIGARARRPRRGGHPARPLHGPRLRGRPTLLGRALGPLERLLYRPRRRPREGDGLEGVRDGLLAFHVVGFCSTCSSASRGCCR